MHVHFIAIGGAVMHNMALAMHSMGHRVTGSDDQIFEPSCSRLAAKGILPEPLGWYPEKITDNIDAVILGMHARKDNPELLKAQKLGVKIYSFPEYIYENSKNKKRVVIGGSHGKTSVTSMVMHVLKNAGMDFDYLVGSQLKGFETMVRITNEAPVIVIEGDEYLTSPLDLRSKFLWYKPHLAILTGIAWDHINVFPTFEGYVDTFRQFLQTFAPGGKCFYFANDKHLQELVKETNHNAEMQAYTEHPFNIVDEQTVLLSEGGKEIPVKFFGKHNMQNLMACYNICRALDVSDEVFYSAMQSFEGAGKRLELIAENEHSKVFLDFAHAPSKLQATVNSVKAQYARKKLTAVFELHTFSSLSVDFLNRYRNTAEKSDELAVVYNPEAAEHKKMAVFSNEAIKSAFNHQNLRVINSKAELEQYLSETVMENTVLLLMSSGNLFNLPLQEILKR